MDECINDLDRLQGDGNVLTITSADKVLPGQDKDFETLLDILETTVYDWQKPVPENADYRYTKKPRPFRIVLVCPSRKMDYSHETKQRLSERVVANIKEYVASK
jgi:hypothetical protein